MWDKIKEYFKKADEVLDVAESIAEVVNPELAEKIDKVDDVLEVIIEAGEDSESKTN